MIFGCEVCLRPMPRTPTEFRRFIKTTTPSFLFFGRSALTLSFDRRVIPHDYFSKSTVTNPQGGVVLLFFFSGEFVELVFLLVPRIPCLFFHLRESSRGLPHGFVLKICFLLSALPGFFPGDR